MNRSKWEIRRDILKGIKQSPTKTKTDIFHKSRLPFDLFKKYIKDLTEKGMIRVDTLNKKLSIYSSGSSHLLSDHPKTTKRYRFSITEKGEQLLQKIEDMIEFWESSNQVSK